MSTKYLKIGIAICALWLGMLACNFSFSTAKIENARMARDYDGNDPTTVFGQDEIFYCVVDLVNAPDDTSVKASWVAMDLAGVDAYTLIDETELTTGSGTLHFDLTNTGPWPTGTYAVQLFLNDELQQTLEFTVQ